LSGSDNPQNITGLQNTVYVVTVTDDNGCSTIVNNIIVTDDCQPCEAPVLADVVTIDANCGEANGEVTIVEFSIGNTDGPVATIIETTPATCAASDGSAILTPDTYNYDWGIGITGDSPNNLAAGIYTVTVTETGNPCVNIITVAIDSISSLEMNAQIDNQPNCEMADGTVTMIVTGATNPVSYEWSNGATGATQNNLMAGPYSVTATDANDCITETLFTLTNSTPEATITINTINNNTCTDTNDGQVIYSIDYAAGFIQPAIIEIIDEESNTQVNDQLEAGFYCIVVSDSTGCLAGESCFEILAPENLSTQITIIDQDCTNGGGSISLDVTGGTPDYSYSWSDAVNNNSATRTGLSSDRTYAVTVQIVKVQLLPLPKSRMPPVMRTTVVLKLLF